MKNKLETQMREAMEAASLRDLMPDFDQEALWRDIAARVPEQRARQHLATGWMARAAALLLLIAVAWCIVYFTGRPAQQPGLAGQPKVPAALPAAAPETPKAGLPAAAGPKAAPLVVQTKHHQSGSARRIAPPTTATALAPAPETVNAGSPVITGIPVQEKQAVAVATKKVVHYLDIADELPAPAPAVATSVPLVQLRFNKPGLPDNAPKQKPLKEFVLALGK